MEKKFKKELHDFILCLCAVGVFPLAPLWIYLLYKKTAWSRPIKRTFSIISGLLFLIMIIALIASYGTPTLDKLPALTNQKELEISSNTSYDNADIKIYLNNDKVADVKADAKGDSNYKVALREGENKLKVSATNAKGKTKTSSEAKIVLDTVVPPLSFEQPSTPTASDKMALKVKSEKDAAIILKKDNTEVARHTFTDENYEFQDIRLAEGENKFTLRAKDRAGNESAESAFSITYTKPVEAKKEEAPVIEAAPPAVTLYSVVSVTDGDTVKLSIGGKTEPIRLIGIDTPETVDPRKTVQCFGVEASNKAKELLNGKKVSIEADSTQGDRDSYGRLLRYIYLEDGTFFNKFMIAEGFAHEYTYNSNPYTYQADFKQAERDARNASKGLWSSSTCNGNTESAASSGSSSSSRGSTSTPKPTPATPPVSSGQCDIKGNISSSGERIYHVPGGAYYSRTVIDESAGERWFCSEAEAVAAGWRRSQR